MMRLNHPWKRGKKPPNTPKQTRRTIEDFREAKAMTQRKTGELHEEQMVDRKKSAIFAWLTRIIQNVFTMV